MFDKNKRNIDLLIQLVLGFVFCLLYIFVKYPFSYLSIDYITLLLLVAVLLLVPMGFALLGTSKIFNKWILFSSLSFGIAFLLPISFVSALLIFPWLILVCFNAFLQLKIFLQKRKKSITDYSFLAASLYMPVAAIWALLDRLAIQPMGFSPTIVLLTAIHFHYAGFLLPLISGMILKTKTKIVHQVIGWGVIFGIPLVAVGIISEQYDLPNFIEVTAVCLMSFSGAMIGLLHFRKGVQNYNKPIGMLWMFGGLALTCGMILAFLYGIRTIVPISILTIPWMYAVHGTLNAIGFALPSILAWFIVNNSQALSSHTA